MLDGRGMRSGGWLSHTASSAADRGASCHLGSSGGDDTACAFGHSTPPQPGDQLATFPLLPMSMATGSGVDAVRVCVCVCGHVYAHVRSCEIPVQGVGMEGGDKGW